MRTKIKSILLRIVSLLIAPLVFIKNAKAQGSYDLGTVNYPVYGVSVSTNYSLISQWILLAYSIIAIPLGLFLLIKRKRFAAIQPSTETGVILPKNKYAQYLRWLITLSVLVVLAYIVFIYVDSALG